MIVLSCQEYHGNELLAVLILKPSMRQRIVALQVGKGEEGTYLLL